MNKSKIISRWLFLLIVLFSLSCKKETTSKSAEELLISNAWKASEVRGQIANNPVYYKRGSSGNTINLDNESIMFKGDGTGIYTDNNQGVSSFTWSFTNPEKTKLTWNVQFTPVATIYWEISTLKEGSLKYVEYYNQGGTNIFSTEVRIPK